MDLYKLIEQITDPKLWPDFKNDKRLEELEKLSEDAFSRETFDGYLSYVLITHQICEDLIRLLITESRFTLYLYLVPDDFDYKFSKKDDNSDLDNLMFGQLLDKLDHSLEFDNKEHFIEKCRELNQTRKSFVHELTKIDLDKIAERAKNYSDKYKDLIKLFYDIDDNFRLFFKDHRKDDSWDMMLSEFLDLGEDPDEIKRLIDIRKKAGFGNDT